MNKKHKRGPRPKRLKIKVPWAKAVKKAMRAPPLDKNKGAESE